MELRMNEGRSIDDVEVAVHRGQPESVVERDDYVRRDRGLGNRKAIKVRMTQHEA